MLGNMMQYPLLISSILRHAAQLFPEQQIVSRTIEGPIHSYAYHEMASRAQQVANGLKGLGINSGDRVGTLAWNGYRHVEVYYGASGSQAIVHTVNPRLYAEQIEYIVQHAEDRVLFIDLTFVELVESVMDKLTSVEHFIVLTDADHMPDTSLPDAICYETWLAQQNPHFDWPTFDENSAACLCYTSGTTGHPKGVLYSHRSTVLHALASCLPDALNMGCDSTVLPVVPMYHVSAWGTPYSALIAGAKLVLPGSGMDGASLYELIEREQADLLLGVPTVWLGLLDHLRSIDAKLDSVKTVGVGGAQAPAALAQAFEEEHDVYLMPMWGMTETSPLATFVSRNNHIDKLPLKERYSAQTKAGRAVFGVEMEIFDASEQPLPHDGECFGSLKVRGPWVIGQYFKNSDQSAFDDGWFDTGDVATIDPQGYMQVVDRKKDVIKSGGEWISSIDLENAAVALDGVQEACVIGVPHPKWDERPLLFIVSEDGTQLEKQAILDFLSEHVAKWWLPDDILFVEQLPHTATGKLQKLKLREEYRDYLQPK